MGGGGLRRGCWLGFGGWVAFAVAVGWRWYWCFGVFMGGEGKAGSRECGMGDGDKQRFRPKLTTLSTHGRHKQNMHAPSSKAGSSETNLIPPRVVMSAVQDVRKVAPVRAERAQPCATLKRFSSGCWRHWLARKETTSLLDTSSTPILQYNSATLRSQVLLRYCSLYCCHYCCCRGCCRDCCCRDCCRVAAAAAAAAAAVTALMRCSHACLPQPPWPPRDAAAVYL